MGKKIVVALGGNALGDTNLQQIENITNVMEHVADLIEAGHEVVMVHGNGPQVGKIQLAFEVSAKHDDNLEVLPLSECIAMSQGYIGYHMSIALQRILKSREINKQVASILTHSVVSENDESLKNPTKPIGPFYSLESIKSLNVANYIEDSGRGYRKVVASPKPLGFLEIDSLKMMINSKVSIICAGGGGIPVMLKDNKIEYVDAVIDKDAAAALLADDLDADILLILTGVEKVAINYGKQDQEWLSALNAERLNLLIEEGHFAPGSMLPKIEAARNFVEGHNSRTAIITSIENALSSLNGEKGTHITFN